LADTGVVGSGTAQAGPETGYAGYIRASQALYPRGGMWVFAGWYAVMASVLSLETTPGAWLLRIFYVVALGLGAAGIVMVQRANAVRQFRADEHGLCFGAGAQVRELAWNDVARLRITPARRGARLDIVLSPAAAVTFRPIARQAADLAFMFFVPVTGVRRNIPAIAVPRRDPARYQLPLRRVTPAELSERLAALAPGIPLEVAT
jgi:hypothetical protein